MSPASSSFWWRNGPAFTLVLLAPMVAEVLPGATRFSSLFVLPVEICVWGGGALMIRDIVRRWGLGWRNMLLLALSLSVAEECLIQQTSLAPMVLRLKGVTYAREFGVNYVYLLWALVYESVFVVFVPIALVELIYPERRRDLWLSRSGLIVTPLLFLLGSFLAWYSWTQIARPQVFHVPPYNPPPLAVLIAAMVICLCLFLAIGPFRNALARPSKPIDPPSAGVPYTLGFFWAVLWYGLVLLGFGIAPDFPPAIAVGVGLFLVGMILFTIPRWTASPLWTSLHQYSLIFGVVVGSMIVGFVGFIGSAPIDLSFKVIVNIIAVVLLLFGLGQKVSARQRHKHFPE